MSPAQKRIVDHLRSGGRLIWVPGACNSFGSAHGRLHNLDGECVAFPRGRSLAALRDAGVIVQASDSEVVHGQGVNGEVWILVGSIAAKLHRCAAKGCPGLPYKASERRHPCARS